MTKVDRGISAKSFISCICFIIGGLIAFPCYQAFKTGGYLFYTTGMDEASHLSYPYATYIAERSGRLRWSSHLITYLHQVGLSGGYINLAFDVVCTIAIIIFVRRIFEKLGYLPGEARLGSVLCFIAPIFFTPFNPIFSWLSVIHFNPTVMRWLTMPWNPEMPFIRTPEPQLSWLMITGVVSTLLHTRFLPFALLAIAPFLYSFVMLPLIFTLLASWGAYRISLPAGIVGSFLFCSAGMLVFTWLGVDADLSRFFVFSHLPLISTTGVLTIILYLCIRQRVPKSQRLSLFVFSISPWIVANVQIVSGYLVTPVNYEQYWGGGVLGFISAMCILQRSVSPRRWVTGVLALYVAFSFNSFTFNQRVFDRLREPRATLPRLALEAELFAVNDLYLATYLDLVHPQQEATAFSWTRTLDLLSDQSYLQYECDKRALVQQYPQSAREFVEIFSALDWGYTVQGADSFMSLGRQKTVTTPRAGLPDGVACPTRELRVQSDQWP